MSQILKNQDREFSESNRTMSESSLSSVHDQMITLASVQDCPDDLGGILAVIDAASDSSGSLRYTDDFGMADDPDADSTESPGALLSASDRAF